MLTFYELCKSFQSYNLKSTFLNLSINLFFTFLNTFYHNFIFFIKMLKNVSAKYYQENKERIQKNLMKDIKIFLRG